MPNSYIKEINTYIEDGFVLFLENPEYSQSGFNIVYNFKLTNLSFQGQHKMSTVVRIENLMPGDCRLLRFETID